MIIYDYIHIYDYIYIHYIVTLEYVYVYNNYICLENHLADQVLHAIISSLTTAVCQQGHSTILETTMGNHGCKRMSSSSGNITYSYMEVGQNLENPCSSHKNRWDLWMFIPLKMVRVLIGIDS